MNVHAQEVIPSSDHGSRTGAHCRYARRDTVLSIHSGRRVYDDQSDGVTWTSTSISRSCRGKLKFDSCSPNRRHIVYDKPPPLRRFPRPPCRKGSTRTFEAKHLRVYVYRANRWQLVAQQVTRVSKSSTMSQGESAPEFQVIGLSFRTRTFSFKPCRLSFRPKNRHNSLVWNLWGITCATPA